MSNYEALSNSLDEYLKVMKASNVFNNQDEWVARFTSLLTEFHQDYRQCSNPTEKRSLITPVMYFFAGRMGSFREDAPKALEDEYSNIDKHIKPLLRELWKEEGNPTFNISKSELFEVGDFVNIKDGHLQYIHFNGYKEVYETVELHRYEIKEILENDISNMPQYLVKYGQVMTVVRHDAVQPAIT